MNRPGNRAGAFMWVAVLSLAMITGHPPAKVFAERVPMTVVQDRIYRAGVFLVIDALVENRSAESLEATEVSVEFYTFFDELLRVEHTLVIPTALGPGQIGAIKVVTPNSDAVRKINYRFTWTQDGKQTQGVSKRDVWTIGSPTRERVPVTRTE